MKRIKSTSINSFEKKDNLNCGTQKLPLLPLDNILKEQFVSQEQKVLAKLAFNQLLLKKISDEIKCCKDIEELTSYKNKLKTSLEKFNSMYKQEKALIKEINIKSIEYLSGLHQETKDRLLESNLFDIIVKKLTINYYKNKDNETPTLKEFNQTKTEIAAIYKLKLQMTLQETLISYNDLLLEYLFNESSELTISEVLQQIAVVNEHSTGLKYYVKTIKGTGDCYAQRENSDDYIEVELKSGDLENQPLIKLLFKIKGNYLKFKEILFFIDGDKEQILQIMEDHKIIIPTHIEIEFINTKQTFTDDNYKYFTHNSKDIAFQKIYESLNKLSFKKEMNNLLKQSIISEPSDKSENKKIDLIKYEELLEKNYSLEWLEICQEIGETFIDLNKPISLDNAKDDDIFPNNNN